MTQDIHTEEFHPFPEQQFQIGARVRVAGLKPFVIRVIYLNAARQVRYAPDYDVGGHSASYLISAPERPAYRPTERKVVMRNSNGSMLPASLNKTYRCETDAELSARHADERVEHDLNDPDLDLAYPDAVVRNKQGKPIGVTGVTGIPGPDKS